jgi:hypothetical protein
MTSEAPWIRVQRQIPCLLFLVALALNLANWARIALCDAFALGSMLHDDGFYYLAIARSILGGHGITFDGIHPTTGFQPLYLGLTLVITELAQWTGVSVFRCIFFLNLLLTLGAALVIASALRRSRNVSSWSGHLWAAMILPLCFPLVFKRLASGMEMAVGLFLLSLFLSSLCAGIAHRHPLRARFTQGLVLGAMALTRIDYLVFSAVFAAHVLFARKERRPAQWLPYVAGFSSLVGGYVLLAARYMDTIIPISFLAKRFYTSQQAVGMGLLGQLGSFLGNLFRPWLYVLGYMTFGLHWRWGMVGMGTGVLLLVGGSAALLLVNRRQLQGLLSKSPLGWFVLAIAVHLVVFAWSGHGFVHPSYFWYYTPPLILLAVAIVLALALADERPSKLHGLLSTTAGLVLLLSTACYDLKEDIASYGEYRDMIHAVRALTPHDAVIGSWDAGYNGYWLAPRTVVNLDGMVNSRRYLDEVIKTGDFAGYLAREQIGYLLNMVEDTPEQTALAESKFFHHPGIKRECYDILARFPFRRQKLTIYLLELKCPASFPGPSSSL